MGTVSKLVFRIDEQTTPEYQFIRRLQWSFGSCHMQFEVNILLSRTFCHKMTTNQSEMGMFIETKKLILAYPCYIAHMP